MNELMNAYRYDWIDECIKIGMHAWMHKDMNEWMTECIKICMNECMHKDMNKFMDA